MIVLCLILIVLYAVIGVVKIFNYKLKNLFSKKAYIPITTQTCSIQFIQSSTSSDLSNMKCTQNKEELELNVSFPIYVIGLISFLSWFLFIVFGGIGIAAIPMDLIRTFFGRPKKNYTRDEIEVMRFKLVQDSLKVKEEIEDFKNKNSDGSATRSCNLLLLSQ